MTSEAQLREQFEAYYARTERIIREHGIAVTAGEGGGGLVPVAFTVGAAAQGFPDLVIYGLPPEVSGRVINTGFEVVRKNWPFPSRTKFEGVANLEVAFRDVSRSELLNRIMVLTRAYNVRNNLVQTPILQICWPDKNGVMPFDAGCDPAIAQLQRIPSLRN